MSDHRERGLTGVQAAWRPAKHRVSSIHSSACHLSLMSQDSLERSEHPHRSENSKQVRTPWIMPHLPPTGSTNPASQDTHTHTGIKPRRARTPILMSVTTAGFYDPISFSLLTLDSPVYVGS